jgi:hypothetical protein
MVKERPTFTLKEVAMAFLRSDIDGERSKKALTWICSDARCKGATAVRYDPDKCIIEGDEVTISNIVYGMRFIALTHEDIVNILLILDNSRR